MLFHLSLYQWLSDCNILFVSYSIVCMGYLNAIHFDFINPLRTMQFFPNVPREFAGCSMFCTKCFGYKIHILHFKSTLFCIIYLCMIYSEAFS